MDRAPVSVDDVLGTAYVFLTPENTAGRIARTVSVNAMLDIDPQGNVVGIEILQWPKRPRKSNG